MQKNILWFTFIILCWLPLHLTGLESPGHPYLTFDPGTHKRLPKNYRSCKRPYLKSKKGKLPSRLGLNELKISGSGQFSPANFEKLLKELGIKTGYFIDLRQESHGFLNDQAISWHGVRNNQNKDLSREQIYALETKLLQNLQTEKNVTVFKKTRNEQDDEVFSATFIPYKSNCSEETFIQQKGFTYIRFYVQNHFPPKDEQIDRFVDFVKNLSQPTWLHFHCRSGHGRTTTFMVLYDMIHNADKVSLKEIINRHALIGGENLFKTHKARQWQIPNNKKRLKLVKDFYQYVNDPNGYNKQSWSQWKSST